MVSYQLTRNPEIVQFTCKSLFLSVILINPIGNTLCIKCPVLTTKNTKNRPVLIENKHLHFTDVIIRKKVFCRFDLSSYVKKLKKFIRKLFPEIEHLLKGVLIDFNQVLE